MPIAGLITGTKASPVSSLEVGAALRCLQLRPDWPGAKNSSADFGIVATSPNDAAGLLAGEDVAVACDADILNRAELAADLSLADDTPTAALIAAVYRSCGDDFLQRLRGCFAIALWDRRERRLVLAVDRIGVKPLAYAQGHDEVLFASQPSGIFAFGRLEKRVNLHSLLAYFTYTAVAAPLSAFQGVLKVEPGCCVTWQGGRCQTARYWDMHYAEDARKSTAQLARDLRSLMRDAVQVNARDLAAAHTGCFLSGGTDSSSVVGLLTEITGAPVNTFSIGFEEGRFNELSYAHLAVRHFGARHHERILGPNDAFAALPQIVRLYDEPFGNSSVIPTYYCLEMAREAGITTMLAGDGGDELFAGNERYRTDKIFQIYHQLPRVLRRGLLEPVLALMPEVSVLGRAKRYVRACNTPHPERYVAWGLLQRFGAASILGAELMQAQQGTDLLAGMRAHFQNARAHSELNRLLYVDVKMTLGDNDLPKVVRSAELAGVRVRFPYVDHLLAEFSGHLPATLKLRGFNKRFLFKEATRSLLPAEILAKKKHGFGLPIGMWLKTDPQFRAFSREVLFDPATYQRGYFQRKFIEQLMDWMENDDTPFYGDLLWLFLILELWHRQHLARAAEVGA